MAKKKHEIKSLMLGRVCCECGWYWVLPSEFALRSKMMRYDGLLDEFNEHAARMASRGT